MKKNTFQSPLMELIKRMKGLSLEVSAYRKSVAVFYAKVSKRLDNESLKKIHKQIQNH